MALNSKPSVLGFMSKKKIKVVDHAQIKKLIKEAEGFVRERKRDIASRRKTWRTASLESVLGEIIFTVEDLEANRVTEGWIKELREFYVQTLQMGEE